MIKFAWIKTISDMKTFKDILQLICGLCVIICPISFVLTFVGFLVLNANLIAYSFFTLCFTFGYAFFYIAFTNKIFKV